MIRLILGHWCPICLAPTSELIICSQCRQKLKTAQSEKLSCINCGRRSAGGLVHYQCQTKNSPLGGFWLFDYNQITASTIKVIKYKLKGSAKQVVNQLFDIGSISHPLIDYWRQRRGCLVPIPSHPSRSRWRGFDLSRLIAEQLSLRTNLKISPCLKRNQPTRPLIKLNLKQRRQQLRGVFTCQVSPPQICVLVDDIITSGTTIKSAAERLYKSGAGQVWFFSLIGRV